MSVNNGFVLIRFAIIGYSRALEWSRGARGSEAGDGEAGCSTSLQVRRGGGGDKRASQDGEDTEELHFEGD